MGELLSVRNLSAGYFGRPVLREVHLSVKPGEFWAVLGPNGAGKSTLVRACMGLLPPTSGEVSVLGRALGEYSRRELGQKVAWVPQVLDGGGDFSGLELVLLGRSPHLGLLGLPSSRDVERGREILASFSLSQLAMRRCEAASGGERRLLYLARALAQEPQLLMLDEPSAFLDVRHQLLALGKVRERVRGGLGALAVLHDVNLAAMFADQVLLLKDGAVLGAGPAEEVLREEVLEELFDVPWSRFSGVGGQRMFAPRELP